MFTTCLARLSFVAVAVALSACGRTPVVETAPLDAPEPLRTYVVSPPPTLPRTGGAFPLIPEPFRIDVVASLDGGPTLELPESAPADSVNVSAAAVSAAVPARFPTVSSVAGATQMTATRLVPACAAGTLVAPQGYLGPPLAAGTRLVRHQIRRGDSWWLYRHRSGVHYTMFAKLNSLPLSTVTAGKGLVAGEFIWLAERPVVLC